MHILVEDTGRQRREGRKVLRSLAATGLVSSSTSVAYINACIILRRMRETNCNCRRLGAAPWNKFGT
eukprot:639113-Pyramimonas_sp.AAC.1